VLEQRRPSILRPLCRRLVWLVLSALVSGCARAASSASSPWQPAPPLVVPGPGASGCVESRELKDFVLGLERARSKARAQALAQLGVVERPRQSRFAEQPAVPSDGTYERDGQRFAVVAQLATSTPPLVPLAQREQLLHRIDERPRAHPIALRVCGVNACPPPVSPTLPPVRALVVALAAGEQLGPPLPLSYDYWWAQVSYDRARSCAARKEPAPSPGAPSK
jgi:hypothetical protein